MERQQIFEQPSFIPYFKNYGIFDGSSVGMTGHLGVLGSILYKRMIEHGIQVEAYSGDITDVKFLTDWFEKNKFEFFFHFAALVPVAIVESDVLVAYETNVIGTYNICREIIKTQKDCWLFLASTSHVYKSSDTAKTQPLSVGDKESPVTFYGASKLAGEQIARPILKQCGIRNCIGRIFSFSHVSQEEPFLVPTLKRRIEELPKDGELEVINPDSIRDIMDAETVIDSILHLARNHYNGTINIGTGKGLGIAEVARLVAEKMNKNISIRGVNKTNPNSLVANIEELKKLFLD